MTERFAIVGAVALAGFITLSPHAQGPSGTTFGKNRIFHLGIVVRDIEASTKAYADLFGVPVPTILTHAASAPHIPFGPSLEADPNAYPKHVFIRLSDFALELLEPVGGRSPWRNHLDKYGEGPHHLAFAVDDVVASAAYLESFGGVREMGGVPDFPSTYVNFKPQLGMTIEAEKYEESARPIPLPPTSFGSNPTSRVTVVVTDVEKAATLFEKLVGVKSPELRVVGPNTNLYPSLPGFAPANEMKFADRFRLNGMHVEIQQALSDTPASPWRIAYSQRGPSIFYLGFHVKDIQASIDYLVKKGGKVAMTNSTNAVAYIDMPSPISLKIALFPPLNAPPPAGGQGRGR